jgi:hypothetical protein
MTGDDPIATGQAVKRTEALLRDARAVLRRVDVLLATALAIEDPALPEIAASATPAIAWSPSSAGGPRNWRRVEGGGRWRRYSGSRAKVE